MTENTTCTLPVPVSQPSASQSTGTMGKGKRFSFKEQMMIGLIFLSGILDAKSIAHYFGCSEQYVRRLSKLADEFFDSFQQGAALGYKLYMVTPLFIDRVAIALSVICQASLEDVSRCIYTLFNYSCSPSKVSLIRKKYSARAREFNHSMSLDLVRVACSDEIFFGTTPVLCSIDPVSTFILDIVIAKNRKKETWQAFMDLLKKQGLDLTLSISDGGTGLLTGIKSAFKDCFMQKDVFHILMELGHPVYAFEESVYSYLGEYYEKKLAVCNPRAHASTIEKVAEMEREIGPMIDKADTLSILFRWIQELLRFPHYTKEEVYELISWCLEELDAQSAGVKHLHKEVGRFQKRLPETLSYLDFMDMMMKALAESLGLTHDVLKLMYRLEGYSKNSPMYKCINRYLNTVLGKKRAEVQEQLDILISTIVRCSSIVENLNSRLRTAFNDMRGMTDDFVELLHCYYNTKEYRRSNVEERVGKSPLELYNGDIRRFFDIIMPEWTFIA